MWAYLLDARDGHGSLQASVLPLFDQLVVNLSGAEDHPLHFLRLLGRRAVVWDQPLEVSSCTERRVRRRSPASRNRTGQTAAVVLPGSISSKLDLASGRRSRDLGVKTISCKHKQEVKGVQTGGSAMLFDHLSQTEEDRHKIILSDSSGSSFWFTEQFRTWS